MPLQLSTEDDTLRPKVITWNPFNAAEANDAWSTIKDLRIRGFTVEETIEGEVRLLPPKRDESVNVMRILSQNGDDRLVWDRRIPEQVKQAFAKFKELLVKGYTAYVTRSDGSKGHRINEFDPGLEEVFFQKGVEIVAVPATVPG